MIGTLSCLLLLSTTFCEGSFYISQDKSKWSEQSRNCNPVTPEVRADDDTDYQVSETLGIDLSLNERVWVGYYQVDRVFEYIGCVSIQNVLNNEKRSFVEIKGDPGHCFPGCGDDIIIGVTRNRCYCLGSDFNEQHRTETECTDKCNGPFVACGKDTRPIKYSYLSIYKMNTNVTASAITGLTEEKNCITLEPNVPKRLIWDKCTEFLLPMCTFGDDVRTVTSEGRQQHFSWTGAANICFQNKVFPTNYSNSKLVDRQNGPKLWTGMFVTSVVHRYNAKVPANRRHDSRKFGYLKSDSVNDVKLQFTDTDTDKRRLCEDGSATKSSTQNVLTTSFSQDPSTTLANVTDMPAKSSFDTYVIVGVCVSVILISVIIVSVVCFFRRRKKKRRLTQGDKTNQTPENWNNNTNIPAQNSFQRNNDYFVLESIECQNDNGNETYDTAIEEHMASDTMKDIADSSKIKAENVYNHLGDETNYDHPITNNERNPSESNENEIDETYDKSIVATKINFDGRLLDNIYNQSGANEEDEYNLLGPQVKKLKTDNVYGVQGRGREHMDNEYDMSISRHCKINEQTDNTYSCLADKSKIEK